MYKNTISLIGFVGKDPVVRTTEGGKKYALFSLATNEYIGKNDDGSRKERTDWHRIIAWGKLADYAEQYIRKGSHLAVDGPVRYSAFEKDGQRHQGVSVKADTILKLDRAAKADPQDQGNEEELPF